jgi:prepilin-type N-terminal cleavage/methylation domain-containing protein/prepilin-type processing-associated H-X9-DG protein
MKWYRKAWSAFQGCIPHKRSILLLQGILFSFTLIELLVVIAVISVLVALISPALREAKESARTVICINNLHQLGVAVHTYGNDHARFPFRNDLTGNSCWKALGPYIQTTNVGTGTRPANLPRTFECPAQKTKATNNSSYPGYSVNIRMMRLAAIPTNQVAYPFLDRPAEVIMIADTCQDDTIFPGWPALNDSYVSEFAAGNYNPATANNLFALQGPDADTLAGLGYFRYRHKQKACVVFVDGHVELIGKNLVYERYFKTLPGQ